MIPTTPGCVGEFAAHAVQEPVKSQLLASLRDLVKSLSPHGKFPGPNPCSFEKADLPTVQKGGYWLCEKTDGTRTLLFFTTFQGTKLACLVTRAWDVYIVGIRNVPRALFQGSLLDGELVRSVSSVWTWLGFDAVVVSGVPVWALDLSQRLQAAARGLSAYRASPSDALLVSFKTYFRDFDEYTRALPGIPHPTDGTVLTPERGAVVLGRHAGLFKLKDSGKHTVDFEFTSPDVLTVYCPKRGKVAVGQMVRSPFTDCPPDGSIVEASYRDKTFWTLVMIRSDKTTSNDMLTYTKTMINIRENLTLADVRVAFI